MAGFAAQQVPISEWEVIVIDNNTSDESISHVQRDYRQKINVTLIQRRQLIHPFALSSARNLGLKLACGEWIAVMDADTIPNSSYIASLKAFIADWRENSVIATCERQFVSTDTITDEVIEAQPNTLEMLPVVLSPSNYGKAVDRRLPAMLSLPNLEHPWDYMHGCNVIFRKQDALSVGGYDEHYDGHWGFEDIDFAYRMIKNQMCEPLYAKGLHVYHQDLEGDNTHAERLNKGANPNWRRVCRLIPGYEQHKTAKYQKLSADIKV